MQELQGGTKTSTPVLSKSGKASKPAAAAKKAINPFLVKPESQKPKAVPAPTRQAKPLAPKQEVKTSKRSLDLDIVPVLPVSTMKRRAEVKVKQEPVEEEEDMENVDQVLSDADEVDGGVPAQHRHDDAMDLNDINFDDDDGDDDFSVKKEKDVTAVETKPAITSEELLNGWESIKCEDVGQSESVMDVHMEGSELPLVADDDGNQVLRFYWLDTFEDPYKQPGSVYLFGKMWIESAKTHVSCCVTVKHIERKIYLLPRATKMDLKTKIDTEEPVSMMDVYQEFNDKMAERHKITKFKSKKATKKYAFEKADVPVESDYLEVHYAADLPVLPSDLHGETFSHVFGTHTSSLENLLIDRKMKGPCWLDLHGVQSVNPPISWCKVEAVVSKPDNVTISAASLPPPPLVVLTLNLRTLPNPKTHQNEVVGAAALIHSDFHMDKPAPDPIYQHYFSVISKPNDLIFPFDFRDKVQREKMKVEVLPTERALLGFLLAKVHKVDPDLIVGHDIYGFDLDILLHRISANKIPHWSKIGRLKRTVMPKLSGGYGKATLAEKSAMCGRLLCDVKISAREVIRCKSYDLTELTSHILHQKRQQLDYDQIREMYGKSDSLLRLVELMLMDTTFVLRILYELNVIPLALQITNICGNIMGRTLMGGRSERNEYLLLHAFTEKGFLCPDKEYKQKAKHPQAEEEGEDEEGGGPKKSQQGRRKPAYTGGLVLEPKKGFYDKYILLLDFNSLYPSIIQEFNICFTTITRSQQTTKETEEDLSGMLPAPELEPGVLPTEIRKLVESRRQVKQLMKSPDVSHEQLMQYDIRQKALKLTANSMYGCLGFTFSRFFAKPLAALVTGKGREILMKTKQLVEGMGLEVIYGDTDSIMVNTNSTDMDQVFKLGNRVKAEVNKLYRLLEIDMDGVFKSMLLLKKKKYAALNVTKNPDGSYSTSQELKGLDIVRRDWCDLAKEAGNFVVIQILSGEVRETVVENIHTKLQEVGEKVRNNELPVELYHITKQLTKNPEDYPDKKNQSHVQVALRLNSKGGKKIRAGDAVSYVICQDGSNLSATQRAYHPDELAKSDTLKLDTHYYLANQIHPVVSRLCDPIEGTDAAHLAECLGLDPSGYRHSQQHAGNADEEDALLAAQMTEEERFRDCTRFKFVCPVESCGRENIVDSVFSYVAPDQASEKAATNYTLAQCQRSGCGGRPYYHLAYLHNRLVQDIRSHIAKYYAGWLKCEDSACGSRTRKLPLTFQRGHPICTICQHGILHREYSDSALYTQLCFYQFIFDVEKAKTLLTNSEKASAESQLMKDSDMAASVPAAYRALKNTVDSWQRSNAYSQVNLDSLFQGLFVFKHEK
ncbi:DNA polymerase alpha catalytic subunit-like [Littorina saxatilis]|uniref:DNA polymerase alpha catalytic subunit-like n=1 Tax=Littorina saxatilis TaxID=31220 RepID=UPI0038B44241